MVQLVPLLDLAGSIAAQLITTSGTVFSTARPTGGELTAVVDPATLATTTPSGLVPVLAGEPAIIVPVSAMSGAEVATLAQAVPVRDTDLVFIALPTVLDLRALDVVTIDTCRDPRLVGATATVFVVESGTAGVIRRFIARPGVLGVPGAV